jgi:predicted nucleic acid-binding protein
VNALLDTSVVIASLDPDEPHHIACDRLLQTRGHKLYVHAFAETFSILTGGRDGRRLSAASAARLIDESVLPFVEPIVLTGRELMKCLANCEARGVRGGAIYDMLHLEAARKSRAEALITLDVRNFQALTRPGDPRIEAP